MNGDGVVAMSVMDVKSRSVNGQLWMFGGPGARHRQASDSIFGRGSRSYL